MKELASNKYIKSVIWHNELDKKQIPQFVDKQFKKRNKTNTKSHSSKKIECSNRIIS